MDDTRAADVPWLGRGPSGLLWRPQLAELASDEARRGRLGFVEVIAESIGSALPSGLADLRQAGVAVVPHGVSLGLGGGARPDRRRLARLARVAELCGAPLVSEHIAFVRARGIESGHLLPVPRTREALAILAENARVAAAEMPVRLALEPVAALVEWPHPELTELEFLTELLTRADVDLLIDVANLHVNAANRRRAGCSGPDADASALIERLPLERVAYVHAAGGRVIRGRHHDTHADPLWPEVDALVEAIWARREVPGLLLERDADFPAERALLGELDRLAAAMDRGRARRAGRARSGRSGRRDLSAPPGRTDPMDAGDAARPVLGHGTRREPGSSRRRLAAAQATFLRAVSGGGAAPAGFEVADLDAVAAMLAKRRREQVAHAAPDVAALGAFVSGFTGWARTHPLTARGAAGDAAGFVGSLPAGERSPYACSVAVRLDLTTGSAAPGDHRRRGRWLPRPPVRLRARRAPGVVAIGARVGRWTGVHAVGHW